MYSLAGTLMALAIYNHHFIDMPLVPTIYKILLHKETDLNDLHQWQPQTAKSLQYILDYKDSLVPLQDIIQRNFTVDQQVNGMS